MACQYLGKWCNMKLIVTVHDQKMIEDLAKFADGFIIGNEAFGTRLARSFSISEINQALNQMKSLGKLAFLNLNQMYTDAHILLLKAFLVKIDTQYLTGVIVADLGVIDLLKTLGLEQKAIYNPETLLTNSFDFNYLKSDHIYGAYVAKEITLSDIKEIGSKKAYHLFMVGHGHLNMFYSKRKLLHNYNDYINADVDYQDNYDLRIVEEKRSDSPYPVLEDKAGTHVFRSKVFSTLKFLNELSDIVDYLVIDTIFKDDVYALSVLKLYKHQSVLEDEIADIQKHYDELWDDGFLNVKTVYKR